MVKIVIITCYTVIQPLYLWPTRHLDQGYFSEQVWSKEVIFNPLHLYMLPCASVNCRLELKDSKRETFLTWNTGWDNTLMLHDGTLR